MLRGRVYEQDISGALRRRKHHLHQCLRCALLGASACWAGLSLSGPHADAGVATVAAGTGASACRGVSACQRVPPQVLPQDSTAQPLASGRRALLSTAAAVAGLSTPTATWAELTPTPRGLQFEILTQGTGEPVVKGEQVQVYFNLWINGFEPPGSKSKVNWYTFKTSSPALIQTSRRKIDTVEGFEWLQEPLQFQAGRPVTPAYIFQITQGMADAAIGMRVGEVRRFVIPPELGYGNRIVPFIRPNSTLYMEYELFDKGMPEARMNERWYGEKPIPKKSKAPAKVSA